MPNDLPIFAMEAMADFRTVGAVAPSSRFLTEAMLRPLPLARARVVVEIGSGTGALTRALLKCIAPDATLLAFEINSRFTRYLRSTLSDPRLQVINASAETLRTELRHRGHDHVDAVASSLALALMPEWRRSTLLGDLSNLLGKGGVFTQYQYTHGLGFSHGRFHRFNLGRLLERYFHSVKRTTIWRNLPPAFVFNCRAPV